MNQIRIVLLIQLLLQSIFAMDTPRYIDLSKVNWEYQWGDRFPLKQEQWKSIEFPSNPPDRNAQTNVWYRVKIPGTLPKDPTLYIFSIDLIAEVYFQGKKIYGFGSFDANGKGKFEGWPWHMIELPKNIEGEYLYFRIYSDYPDIGLWGEISIASKGTHLERMLDEDLLHLTIGAVTYFVGLLFLVIFFGNRFKIEFLLLSLLFLTQGIDMLVSTKTMQLYFNYPLLKQYILAFCYFFVPIGMAALLEYFIGAGIFKVIRRIWQFHSAYLIISFSGAIMGLYNVSSLYTYFDYIYYFLTFPILTVVMVYTLYNGDREKKIIASGFLIMSLSWLHSSLIAWGFIPWQEHPSYIAVLLCLSLFAYILVRKVMITKEIQRQKDKFESIFKSSKDGIAITDLKSRFLECNDAFTQMMGYTKEELLKKNCTQISDPKDKHRSKEALKEVIKKGFIENFEKTCLLKEDKKVEVNMTISLMPDKKRLLFVTKDITSLKLFERQSKLASMGEMIGNIAHQWRQPLSVISTGATGLILQKELNRLTDEQFINICNTINDNTQYLSKTIDDFRAFIKGDRKRVEFNLSDNIESFLNLVEAPVKSNNIQIIKDINGDITINSYPNELIQCFINIFNNSKDAFKDNDDQRVLFISAHIKEDKVTITLKDNAGGIPDDVLPHIYEPYFTTKHQSQGTGLGLHMTYNLIVDGLNGTIEANNMNYEYNGKKYTGAEFNITLPYKGQS